MSNPPRELDGPETAALNDIHEKAVDLGRMIAKLRALPILDQRWVSIGATDLQTGVMALKRAVLKPTTF